MLITLFLLLVALAGFGLGLCASKILDDIAVSSIMRNRR